MVSPAVSQPIKSAFCARSGRKLSVCSSSGIGFSSASGCSDGSGSSVLSGRSVGSGCFSETAAGTAGLMSSLHSLFHKLFGGVLRAVGLHAGYPLGYQDRTDRDQNSCADGDDNVIFVRSFLHGFLPDVICRDSFSFCTGQPASRSGTDRRRR